MHGIVFEELREFVWRSHGPQTWAELLAAAVPDRRFYAPDAGYPDEELEALVAEISKRTGSTRGELLHTFGEFVAPTLLELYRPMLDPAWSLLDLLENVEETIHRVVRLDDPTASPPNLRVERAGDERVVIHYESERKMCDFAKGIVNGLQGEYGQQVDVTDLSCMHKGDPTCTIEVVVTS